MVTSGFFNSLNGDRKYNAEQLSSIFEGIITEGVFEHVGDCFKISTYGMEVTIGTGRVWLNSKWLLNDSDYVVGIPDIGSGLPRYDAIVFDMNSNMDTRENSIKLIMGEKSANPQKPEMIKDEKHKQYPICYIYRYEGQTQINAEDIEYMVGKADLPFITAPLQFASIQQHFDHWEGEWEEWFDRVSGEWGVITFDEIDALFDPDKEV